MGNDKTVALAVADRIKQFIDYLGITITQFADNTGIQRPSMSQMLSGRNQKISITTIGKIHERYPDLSIYWLLYGNGPMLLSESNGAFSAAIESSTIIPTEDDSGLPTGGSPFMSLFDDESGKNTAEDTSKPEYAKENSSNRAINFANSAENESERSKNIPYIPPREADAKNRRIVKIMIFYSDNTFESFSPES